MSDAAAWLVLAILAGIVEVLSPIFGYVFVAGAAVLSAGAAALGAPRTAQIGIFGATLLGALLLLRPRLVRTLGSAGIPSRTEVLLGKIGQVTQAIDPVTGSGRVVVAGEDWAARSASALAAGRQVRIERADGIVLHVVPIDTGA